ncbi:hypothetical protein LJC13_04465 [Peptostreptococcaceae bacterium OttesenSCG-928-C18]|nr:hypothetical protein [Peptostreptococcaceae bacterium OttesenSCG-928-C18]
MKKKLLILLLVAMMLLTACNSKKAEKTTETTSATQTTQEKETEKETEIETEEDDTEEIIKYFSYINEGENQQEDAVLTFNYDSSSKTEIVKERDEYDIPFTKEIKEAIVELSNAIVFDIGKGYTVEYRNKEDEVLLKVLDGKILEMVETVD